MKAKIYLLTAFLAVAVIAYGFASATAPAKDKHPDVDWTIGCTECHEEMTPEVFKDWQGSKHGEMNFGCYICHGDGQETFYKKGKDDQCLGCHAAQEVNFKKSVAKTCFTCHKGHTLKFHN